MNSKTKALWFLVLTCIAIACVIIHEYWIDSESILNVVHSKDQGGQVHAFTPENSKIEDSRDEENTEDNEEEVAAAADGDGDGDDDDETHNTDENVQEDMDEEIKETNQDSKSQPAIENEQTTIEHKDEDIANPNDTKCTNDIQPWNNETFSSIVKRKCSENQKVQLVNDVIGEVLPDGQLVVNLVNRTDHQLWFSEQTNLCNLLQNMALIDSLPSSEHVSLPKRPLLNMTFDCLGMYKEARIGQGNWVTAIYTTRITAAAARVDFQFQCYEGRDSQMVTLLPWLETYQPAPTDDNPWPFQGRVPTNQETCSIWYQWHRIDFMIDEIMNDMQRMGVTILGSHGDKTHPDVPVNQPALLPEVEVEDVVIHFRCGDVFGGVRRGDFGIIKFTEYKKYISKDAKSVGIVTQPFTKEGNRRADQGKIEDCKKAVDLMQEYLQDYLPSAKISIHNGPEDTLPLTYARLAMADQSFTSLSSFGIFPVIGGFGKGYFQKGNRGVNPFNIHLPAIYPEKLFMMDGPVMTSAHIGSLQLEEVFEWLVHEDEESS